MTRTVPILALSISFAWLLAPTLSFGQQPAAARAAAASAEGASTAIGDSATPETALVDSRLGPLRTLDSHSPFAPPATVADWHARARQLRQDLLVNLGLWPLPTRTPLEPVIHGRRELDGYCVEKVYFQSMPGFYVTGSLFRPLNASGPRPAVLCPHGHWPNGRFYDAGPQATAREIEAGGEKFAEGGRNPVQARCVHLARMGCVVFLYDMIGYADSVQIGHDVAHGFSSRRPEMETPERWGLFSTRAELHQQHVMGLQTYNSIRALDFLVSLPDVDSSRIAVTGASGGGTQTFILAAIDDRPRVVFPAVMVSTGMQGGCTCENCCGIRTTTGNVEIAALAAPRPQGLTAADDWTREMTTDGFPQLQQIYTLLGARDHTHLTSLTQFGHNYNAPSRAAMYAWLNQHLALGFDSVPEERDYQRLTGDELTVWDDQHPRPPSGPDLERKVLEWWHQDSQQRLQLPTSDRPDDWLSYQQLLRPAWRSLVKREAPHPMQLDWQPGEAEPVPGTPTFSRTNGYVVFRPAPGQIERLPVTWLQPASRLRGAVVWLSDQGRDGLWASPQRPVDAVGALLDRGIGVLGVDLIGQGELEDARATSDRAPTVDTPRQFAGYTFGYNHPRFVQRAHDVMTAASLARRLAGPRRSIGIIGTEGTGKWILAARAADPNLATAAVAELDGFTCGAVPDWTHPDFMHGAGKYGDVAGMIVAAAPSRLWVQGLSETDQDGVKAAYSGLGQADRITVGRTDDADSAIQWLADQLLRGAR